MFLQQSQNVDVLSSAGQIRLPIGSGLNGATPSLSAIDGSIALNITDGNLYYVGGNVWKTTTGSSSTPVTLTLVGSSPNANGASIAGQVLNLQPANASFPGVVSTTAQTFSGVKTFLNGIIAPGISYSAVDPTAGTIANDGFSINNTLSQINLEFADATHNGIVSTTAQTFSGVKTFTNGIIAPGISYSAVDPTVGTIANDGFSINNTLSQINLEFADATHNGIVSTVAQTFSGVKTFTNGIIAPGINYSVIAPIVATNNDGIIINNTLSQINLEFADDTHNGIVSTTAQTFSGVKTFTDGIIAPGLNYSAVDPTSGTIANDGFSINNTLSQINLEFADATHNGIVSTGAQTFGGTKTFSAIVAPGTNYTTIAPTSGTVANVGLVINNSLKQINLEFADATHNGIVSTVAQTFGGAKTFTDGIVASGTNYTTITPIVATDNNGLIIDNILSQFSLELADATHNGIVSTGAQTFGGTKTFSAIVAPGTNYTTIAPTTGTVANVGLVINNSLKQVNLEFADATHNGIVSTGAQTFGGTKTFSAIIAPGTNYTTIAPTASTAANDGLVINNSLKQVNLEFADATHNGIVSTVAQTFSGVKTFTDGFNAPGTNYTTIAPTAGTVANDGLVVNNTLKQINLEFADATHNGIMSTISQNLAGTKIFNNGIRVSNVTPSAGVTNVFSKYFFKNIGVVNVTGALTGTLTLSAQVFDSVCSLMISGGINNLNCPGGLATVTQVLDPEFRPLTAGGHGGNLPIMNSNVYSIGTLEVSTGGVITIGIGWNADFTQTVWGVNAANNNGLFDCTVQYSLL